MSIPPEKCANCGATLPENGTVAARGGVMFCSVKCGNAYRNVAAFGMRTSVITLAPIDGQDQNRALRTVPANTHGRIVGVVYLPEDVHYLVLFMASIIVRVTESELTDVNRFRTHPSRSGGARAR